MSTAAHPTLRSRWRSARAPLAVVAAMVATAGVLAMVQGGRREGLLDPAATDPAGSRAVAELLRDQGIEIVPVRTAAEALEAGGERSTLLVAHPDSLTTEQLELLADSPSDVLLVGPGDEALRAFAPTLRRTGDDDVTIQDPRCDLEEAVNAGSAHTGGALYAAQPSTAVLCFPAEEGSSLVRVGADGRTVTVLGSGEPLTNDRLDEAGNAALALGLLGAHPTLVWHHGTAVDDPVTGAEAGFWDLVPQGWVWGAFQAAVGVVLVAVWRGRRLGPVVPEPLPVVVRAAEAVEGRGRLYHRSGARDRAAVTLRTAACDRLARVTGAARSPDALADAVATRTNRARADVVALLFGPPPGDDKALVRLADDLDALEMEVNHP